MNHRVYTGSFAGLERRWLDEVASLQSGDPLRAVDVLVGSNVLATYLKVLLARRGGAAANVRFHTFLDLVTALARVETPARPRLPRLGNITILDELLEADVPDEFKNVVSYPGFRANLLATFRDLRDAGISAPDLDRSLPELKHRTRDRERHLEGIATLYRRFRREVERFHDIDDDFRVAIRNAPRATESIAGRSLLVYGIYDATGQQEDLLRAISDTVDLTYFVPFVHSSESRFAESFLASRCRELNVAAQPAPEPSSLTALGILGAGGFGFRPGSGQTIAGDGSVRLVSAPGQSRAAVEVVREVLAAVRDEAARGFHEIAVLFRHPREEAPMVAEALRLRGIPHFLHGGTPFEGRPLCRAVIALAGLERDEFSRARVLAAMEFLEAALPPSSARDWDAQQFRALTRDAKFLSGIEGWNAGTDVLVRYAEQDCKRAESGEEVDEEHKSVPSPARARMILEHSKSLRKAWRAVRDAAAGWPIAQSWPVWATLLEQRMGELLSDAEDWEVFLSIFDELRSLGSLHERRRVSRSRMLSLLKESISGHGRSEGRIFRHGVNLLPLAAARGLRFPVVIIPGLEEGSFPARPRQDPLLLDRERAVVGGMFSKLPLKAQRRDEETLLFNMAARSAGRRLVLLTSRLDERTDRERIPSEFFLRVAEFVAGSPLTLQGLREGSLPGFRSVSLENSAPKAGQVPVDEGEIRLRLITHDRSRRRSVLRALALAEPELLQRSMAFDEARWKKDVTEFDGRIFDPELTRWVAARVGPAAGPVSATRLEAFARCPYFFYLQRAIGLEEWEEPEPSQGLDPRSRGSIIHAILEEFLRGLDGGRLFADPSATLEQALLVCSRRALNSNRPPGVPDLLWELEQEATEEVLRNWLGFERERGETGLVPRFVEHPFGKLRNEQPRPAFSLQAGRHTFEFRGKIDRVDLSMDGRRARVIDYKTGKRPDKMEARKRPLLMGGEKIQIAVYRGALKACCPGIQEVIGEYLHLQPRKRDIVECTFDHEALREGLDRLGRMLEIIGDLIEQGIFFARTAGSVYTDNCRFCAYAPVCGKDAARRAELKSQDGAVRTFAQLVEIDRPSEFA